VTLTNTVHEVSPHEIANILADCLLRLTPKGHFFVYDMESLDPHELGAVPWTAENADKILSSMLSGFGCDGYRPAVGRWPHTSTIGWNVTIQREFVSATSAEALNLRTRAVQLASESIQTALRDRLRDCKSALEALTQYGAETKEESDSKLRLLYEHWALSRALERVS
jgi:hypothetical protein